MYLIQKAIAWMHGFYQILRRLLRYLRMKFFGEQNLNLYDNKYNELFNKEYFESEANNILEILDVLPVTVAKESKEAVIDYLKESGVKLDKEV